MITFGADLTRWVLGRKGLSVEDFDGRAFQRCESGRRCHISNVVVNQCGWNACTDHVLMMLGFDARTLLRPYPR